MNCLSSVIWSLGLNQSIVGWIGWCFWYYSCNYSPKRFKTQSFSKKTNDHASTSDLYQDHLHTLRDHLDKSLDLLLLRLLFASTMLQGSFAAIIAVTPLQKDPLYYWDYSTTGELRCSNRRLIDRLMLTSQKSGRLRPGNPISRYCSARWLLLKLLLMELRVIPIISLPRLAVAFIYRALRFLSTLPPLARKVLIC